MQIVSPVALILSTIDMRIDTITVGFVFLPFAFVYVTICMPEFALSIGLVSAPISFILGSIGPDLDTWAVAHTILKIAFVHGTVFKNEFLDKLQVRRLGDFFKFGKHWVV